MEIFTFIQIKDPHFSDPEMMDLRKNYIGDEEQVKRINSKVGKNDVIIFLGDIGAVDYIKKIRGYKVLVMGNHDKGKSNYERQVINDEVEILVHKDGITAEEQFRIAELEHKGYRFVREYPHLTYMNKRVYKYNSDNHLFDEVYDGPVWIAEKILLSHERINFPFVFNIYGHHHGDPINNDHLMCVCAEHIDYTPVSLLKLVKDGTFSKVDAIHRVTIDTATARKLNKKKNNS